MLDLSEKKAKKLNDLVARFIQDNTGLKVLCSHEANTDSKGVYRVSFFVGTKEYLEKPDHELLYIEELKRYYEGRPGWNL